MTNNNDKISLELPSVRRRNPHQCERSVYCAKLPLHDPLYSTPFRFDKFHSTALRTLIYFIPLHIIPFHNVSSPLFVYLFSLLSSTHLSSSLLSSSFLSTPSLSFPFLSSPFPSFPLLSCPDRFSSPLSSPLLSSSLLISSPLIFSRFLSSSLHSCPLLFSPHLLTSLLLSPLLSSPVLFTPLFSSLYFPPLLFSLLPSSSLIFSPLFSPLLRSPVVAATTAWGVRMSPSVTCVGEQTHLTFSIMRLSEWSSEWINFNFSSRFRVIEPHSCSRITKRKKQLHDVIYKGVIDRFCAYFESYSMLMTAEMNCIVGAEPVDSIRRGILK